MEFLNKTNLFGIIEGTRNFYDISIIKSDEENFHFLTVGHDPQFELFFKKRLKSGYYKFNFNFISKKGKVKNPKFYLDSGSGYNEAEIIELPQPVNDSLECVFHINKPVYKIRFDPTDKIDVSFGVKDITLEYLNKINLFKKVKHELKDETDYRNIPKNYYRATSFLLRKKNSEIVTLLNKGNPFTLDLFNYESWIEQFDTFSPDAIKKIEKIQQNFTYKPLISVILPTYNSPVKWLAECIDSVLSQIYTNWELCIADDNSTQEEVRRLIKAYAEKDSRIKYVFRKENGHISACSNSALALSTGEYVALLDHDDKLAPLALYRMVEALNQDGTIDFLYSDEDKIDDKGQRSLPFFKPDWSPALFYNQNYITHLTCIRKKIIDQVGGFTLGAEGSQDYDLFLKVIKSGAKIKHLPFILYHWRMHEQSTAMQSNSKPYAHTAGKNSLTTFLKSKYPAQFDHVEDGTNTFTYIPRFKFAKTNKVSIIIPTKDKIEYLAPCIESIVNGSTWKNYEIIILNNNSEEKATFKYFNKIQKAHSFIKVIDASFPFNWSQLNNLGSKHASGNYLLFLNNDITIISPDWMERLCSWASLPDVSTVGAMLLYDDETIQHAGVTVGLNGWADHIFKAMKPSHFPSPHVSNIITRNVLAVTGACTAIQKEKFERLGGFDENFIICGSDVELGIRSHKKNLFNVIDANVRLFHYESKSRGSAVPENDFIQSAIKYEPFRTQTSDPFFNPNLSLHHTSPICKS